MEPFLGEPLPEGREDLTVEMLQQELRLLSEAPQLLQEIIGPVDPVAFVEELSDAAEKVFEQAHKALEENDVEDLEKARAFVAGLRAWAKEEGIKTRDLLHPLRLALTGRNRGPEMAYLFAVLGAEEAQSRIGRARKARLRA